MKKILSLVLVIAMIFTLVACANNENKNPINGTEDITENTQSITETQNNTEEDGNETNSSTNQNTETTESIDGTSTENTEDIGGTENTEPPTNNDIISGESKPTETAKPSETIKPSAHEHKYTSKNTKNATCTEKGKITFTCSCGDKYTEDIPKKGHSWGEWKTIKEPTTTTEGISQRKCGNCSVTENKSIAKLPIKEQNAYYVNHEVVKIERPKTYYVDGVDVLTLARGSNWVQICDTIKIKVNMSDGGSDFQVKKTIGGTGFTYEKKGNEVWITPNGASSYIEVLISVKNKDGNSQDITIAFYDVYMSKANLSEEQEVQQMLQFYGQRLGMRYTTSGPEVAVMNNTKALIYDNFKVEAFKTIKKWANDGYTVFCIAVYPHCFDGIAGK